MRPRAPFRRIGTPPRPNFQSRHRHSNFSTILKEATHVTTQNEAICTHLLNACLKECKRVKFRRVFDEMPQRLAQVSNASKVLHAQSMKYGVGSKGNLGNAIVDLYAKCGNVDYAEKACNLLDERDALAWNSVLSMYLRCGMLQKIIQSFGYMQNGGVLPNQFTYAIVLSACGRLVDVDFGRQVHCSVLKMGFEFDSFCEGSLIDMYAKCHFVTDARRVFDGAVEPDTVSWTAMIAGYVQSGSFEEALKVFEEMLKLGRVPDQVAFVTVITACVGLGKLNDACHWFSQMPNPNVVAWNVMISGHAQRGYEAEAIGYFQNMRKANVQSTRSTLGSVMSAVASLAALDLGLQVQAQAIKQGLDSNVYVGSSLINMYCKCEKMEAARKVFDALDVRNVVLWNAMLGGYSQNGYAYEAFELFLLMRWCSYQPDEFTYTSILSACACLESLEMGCQLHSFIIKNNFNSNLFVGNALVDMYAKCGALKEARQQFELIRGRDNVSWNAIIVGYVQEQNEDEAFNIFRRMIFNGVVPDEVSLASVLSACANIQAIEQGKQVHCLSVKSGLGTGLYAGSSLIDMYAKCGANRAAHEVLSCMPEWSVASMNALIAGYAQNNLEEAIDLFRAMQDEGLSPSKITFASLLDACNGAHKLNLGRQIHCLVLKRGFLYDADFLGVSLIGMYMNSLSRTDASILFSDFSHPKSTVLWTAMISGLTQNECSEEALQLYKEMRSYDAMPDQATFACVLRACAILASLRDGREVHSLIFHTGFDLDELTGSAVVDMYAKCGDMKSSEQVFEEMGSKNDVISWNSMIVGFAKNGYALSALKIFDKMNQACVRPDDITFLGVLTACSHAGRVSEGRQIFDIMVDRYKIEPRVDHCACMIDLLGRWGFLKEAEEFIGKLKFEPDAMIWASMLGSCKIHGDDIRGKWAAEKLIELEPQNSSPYVLLSNIYAASGNWDEVNSLRKAMKEKGVRKLPGCSWILVGQKTDLFVAGDTLHPCAGEIHSILKDLTMQMKEDGYIAETDPFLHEEDREASSSCFEICCH
ncbi:pentatricopeptide repeat-containing protein At3g09040, mitochondrial [Malania oleifera]|uniref:pentatricopeptide repeat-containing protein At3g09040, mitochondrial n=1 Tax=Malania oleifera TaxID=397392 RepID=UPI0025AE436C|nr:pentatricopeptide repeat-containing protein At3g09040, mitochondrial [Malania oleifera]XP_057972952.1 pentatricopeptide repeat-containing protein At3g09040, mitochondrial [Malania oleifera]XP_057972953.1 pentatricopeptide repeat-containing protein At3g09040, mitochondrial [Malania oleifera]XP_057972954.1 pentatricopeptide repeat-containing protein At3g09040, mitochondrial [Malania oleifera]XP_057972956.1 pentatricopeptide repeat-containing protein At3g09040, mitochondrial [Malania oleifera]